jgi:hypothetical protein
MRGMTIHEILKSSVSGEALDWANELESNLSKGINYPHVSRVNEFLGKISKEQCTLLKNKFSGISNVYEMNDRVEEVMCAMKCEDYAPIFLDERKGAKTPDLYLEKTEEYVEVKRIQITKKEKELEKLDELSGTVERFDRTQALEKKFPGLKKKIEEKIDKGGEQLSGKPGFIYLSYSLDFINLMPCVGNGFNLRYFLKKEIENYARIYSQQKKLNCICEETILMHSFDRES